MKKIMISLIAAAVLCTDPVHADEIAGKIAAIEAQIKELRQEIIKLKESKLDSDIISMIDFEGCTYQTNEYRIFDYPNGDSCFIVYYTFDNNTDEINAGDNHTLFRAFQDGIELDRYYAQGVELYENRFKNILPGYSIECAEAFRLNNKNNVVLVFDNHFLQETNEDEMIEFTLQ